MHHYFKYILLCTAVTVLWLSTDLTTRNWQEAFNSRRQLSEVFTIATCDDNLKNGNEEAVDCGGGCPLPCPTNCQNYDCGEAHFPVWDAENVYCAAYPCDISDLEICCDEKALCSNISGCSRSDVLISEPTTKKSREDKIRRRDEQPSGAWLNLTSADFSINVDSGDVGGLIDGDAGGYNVGASSEIYNNNLTITISSESVWFSITAIRIGAGDSVAVPNLGGAVVTHDGVQWASLSITNKLGTSSEDSEVGDGYCTAGSADHYGWYGGINFVSGDDICRSTCQDDPVCVGYTSQDGQNGTCYVYCIQEYNEGDLKCVNEGNTSSLTMDSNNDTSVTCWFMNKRAWAMIYLNDLNPEVTYSNLGIYLPMILSNMTIGEIGIFGKTSTYQPTTRPTSPTWTPTPDPTTEPSYSPTRKPTTPLPTTVPTSPSRMPTVAPTAAPPTPDPTPYPTDSRCNMDNNVNVTIELLVHGLDPHCHEQRFAIADAIMVLLKRLNVNIYSGCNVFPNLTTNESCTEDYAPEVDCQFLTVSGTDVNLTINNDTRTKNFDGVYEWQAGTSSWINKQFDGEVIWRTEYSSWAIHAREDHDRIWSAVDSKMYMAKDCGIPEGQYPINPTKGNLKPWYFYEDIPTSSPTPKPTSHPTHTPTQRPTPYPTVEPTPSPTSTSAPTVFPTTTPSTATPTKTPTVPPTHMPTGSETIAPIVSPTPMPSTPIPTQKPITPIPTQTPTQSPTMIPTQTLTLLPTTSPTEFPTLVPTPNPSTEVPTRKPIWTPTFSPTTISPTTISPTTFPTTLSPTPNPSTEVPTPKPTKKPTVSPTPEPTIPPTVSPTISPTVYPTPEPTIKPTVSPTIIPTVSPTIDPTVSPTQQPTSAPTVSPTHKPTSECANRAFTDSGTKIDISLKCYKDLKDAGYRGKTWPPSLSPTHPQTASPFNWTYPPTKAPTDLPTVYPSPYPTYYPTNASDLDAGSNSSNFTEKPTFRPTTWDGYLLDWIHTTVIVSLPIETEYDTKNLENMTAILNDLTFGINLTTELANYFPLQNLDFRVLNVRETRPVPELKYLGKVYITLTIVLVAMGVVAFHGLKTFFCTGNFKDDILKEGKFILFRDCCCKLCQCKMPDSEIVEDALGNNSKEHTREQLTEAEQREKFLMILGKCCYVFWTCDSHLVHLEQDNSSGGVKVVDENYEIAIQF